MLIACPSCGVTCTVDPGSADTLTCPGCGLLMSSYDGTPLLRQVASVRQSLPAAVDEANAPLAATAIGPPVDQIDVEAPSDTPVLFRIGRFVLLEKIGEGGFGSVFRAHDELLDREVALKVPRRERHGSGKSVPSFVREARAVAKLRHPGIVGVYDVGQAEDGSYYIAMELVSGESLSHLIKNRSLSFDESARIVAEIADAVHEAHKQGLVHRDLKPSNVLMDDALRPHVVDFGIAVSEDQQRSLEGDIAGTVPYMSPEQVAGEVHLMDGRSDIWSLGVILYQLLTGRRPFGGNCGPELIQEILRRDPKPPRQINDRIPKRLETICLTALQKRATSRFNTMQDFADDLRGWLSEPDSASSQVHSRTTLREPTTAPLVPAPHVPSRRRPFWMAAGVCLLLVGTMGVTFGLVPLLRRETPLGNNKNVPERFDPTQMEVGVWYEVLVGLPTETRWCLDPGGASYRFDAKRRELWIDSSSLALLSAGTLDVEDFKLEATIHKNHWSGGTGFFWGYQPGPPTDNGQTTLRCRNVFAYHVFDVRGGRVFLDMRHEAWTLREGDGNCLIPILSDFNIGGSQSYPVPKSNDGKLEMTVRGGRLHEVSWMGQIVKGLSDRESVHKVAPPGSRGQFGFYNISGATVFRDVRFMILQKGQ